METGIVLLHLERRVVGENEEQRQAIVNRIGDQIPRPRVFRERTCRLFSLEASSLNRRSFLECLDQDVGESYPGRAAGAVLQTVDELLTLVRVRSAYGGFSHRIFPHNLTEIEVAVKVDMRIVHQ